MPKIKDIRIRKENLDLARPYTISYKTVTAVENVIVEIEADNGKIGMGAANPSPMVVGESVKETQRILQDQYPEWLIGRDVLEFQQLSYETFKRHPKKPGVLAAVDIALYDLFGKCANIPVVDFLGRKIEKLATSITIGIKGVEETLEEAKEYHERGFRILKVKLGRDLEEDIERLAKLKEAYGSSMLIRIDANQGYSTTQLIDFVERTRQLDIELIEQPLPAGETEEAKNLPDEIKMLVAADESLIGPESAFHLLSGKPACGILNIKLMKCGGIRRAMEIACLAEYGNARLMWGCNDESIISISAALHAAYASDNTYYIDLDGSLDLARDVVSGGFRIEEGFMYPSDQPGLGFEKLG